MATPVAAVAPAGMPALRPLSGVRTSDNWQLLPPEVQGSRTLFRTVWPPLVATLGTLPVVFARVASENDGNPYEAAITTGFFVLILCGLVAGWVHQRDAIKAWWRSMQEMQGMGAGAGSSPSGSSDSSSSSTASDDRPGPSGRPSARTGGKPAARKVNTKLERT